jgi:hypothetical protein
VYGFLISAVCLLLLAGPVFCFCLRAASVLVLGWPVGWPFVINLALLVPLVINNIHLPLSKKD